MAFVSTSTTENISGFIKNFALHSENLFKLLFNLWTFKPYKEIIVGLIAIIVFQPLINFLWTLAFTDSGLHERDQLAVIISNALPTWTFCFHFVRWTGGNIGLARLIQALATILSCLTIDINTRIYGTVPLDRAVTQYGEQFYVPWVGIATTSANYSVFIAKVFLKTLTQLF